MPPKYPSFRTGKDGTPVLYDSEAARHLKAQAWFPPQTPSQVENVAKDVVRRRGGDVNDKKDLLGEFILQSGKYRGQKFSWLLENCPGYVGWFVGSILEDRVKGEKSSVTQMANKDALLEYWSLFEESRAIVSQKLSGRSKGIQEQWKKVIGRGNIIPGQQFHLLLSSRDLSPEALRRKVKRIASPMKITPNLTQASRSPATTDDVELLEAVQEFEKQSGALQLPTPEARRKVTRKILQESATTPGTSTTTSTVAAPPGISTSTVAAPPGISTSTVAAPPGISTSTVAAPLGISTSTVAAPQGISTSTVAAPPSISSSTVVVLPGTSPTAEPRLLSATATSATVTSATATSATVTSATATSATATSATATSATASAPLCDLNLEAQSTSSGDVSDTLTVLAGWKKTLPEVDHKWISDSFFKLGKRGSEFDFTRVSKLWYEPPQPSLSTSVLNKPDRYFAHRFFLWMPRHLFHIDLVCPKEGCDGKLTNAGVHQKTRMVLDVDSYYNMAGEYLSCQKCSKKVISWSEDILKQLDNTSRNRFPCILTTKYACDLRVVRLLRQRTLGNSSSAVTKVVEEQHGEKYVKSLESYLSNCKVFKSSSNRGFFGTPHFQRPPPQLPVPRHRWFMKVYQLDVIDRLDYIKASITSQFGSVLKMDSTKKITNKLAGHSRKTAMWATNIGNEYGQVLMSVLTEGEGASLRPMIEGIMSRYEKAGVDPPKVLYVDRDCCGAATVHKYFENWPSTCIRLDIWHFMRRFPSGCTTDKHPLYSIFMGKLSQCVFRWDEDDLQQLTTAKREEMILQGLDNPSTKDVMRRITTAELALHCKRITRGTEETRTLISGLIDSLDGPKGCDTLGVPLFDSERMAEVWRVQQQHVSCIQDPDGVHLYTQTGTLKKGGILLPVYRCARGSTSLESFHLHMNRFIPGVSVGWLVPWNLDREAAAVRTETKERRPRTYSGPLKHSINKLSQEILGEPFFEDFRPAGMYTGELIGIEYLYSQTGKGATNYAEAVQSIPEEDNRGIEDEDEGFAEVEECPPDPTPALLPIPSTADYHKMLEDTCTAESAEPVPMPLHHAESQDKHQDTTADDDVVGPDNIPGYGKVLRLAKFLVSLRNTEGMSAAQVNQLTDLWHSLSDYDKKRTVFPPRHQKGPLQGRFKSPKKMVAPGVESIERVVLGPNQGPAQWPNCNRYTEATVDQLLQVFRSDLRREGKSVSRFSLVLGAFHHIRQTVLDNHAAMKSTNIQLPLLNKKTLSQWFNDKSKGQDKRVLTQGLELPNPALTTSSAPAALSKPAVLPSGDSQPFPFHDPPSAVGLAKVKDRKNKPLHVRKIAPSLNPAISYQIVTGPGNTAVLVPFGMPSASGVSTNQPDRKRKLNEEKDTGPVAKKLKKCSKCGEERNPPAHQQYMGYRFCATVDKRPFNEWREQLKKAGVVRKNTSKK